MNFKEILLSNLEKIIFVLILALCGYSIYGLLSQKAEDASQETETALSLNRLLKQTIGLDDPPLLRPIVESRYRPLKKQNDLPAGLAYWSVDSKPPAYLECAPKFHNWGGNDICIRCGKYKLKERRWILTFEKRR